VPASLNKVVITTWDSAHQNSLQILDALSHRDFSVIDSTDHGLIQNGIKTRNIFFDQVATSINSLSDEEYLTYVSGDVSTSDWEKYIQQVENVIGTEKPWVYSPYLTFEGYPREVSSIGSYPGNIGIDFGCITDGIVFTLHRTLALELLEFISFAKMSASFQVGWGLDWIWCTLAIYENKKILRDSRIPLLHPKSTSYDTTLALAEFRVMQELLMEYAAREKKDLIKIRRIQHSINERIKGNQKFFTLEKFYPESFSQ
jgi:hypothetical protein